MIGYEILLIGGQQLDGYNRIYQRIRFELERKFLEIQPTFIYFSAISINEPNLNAKNFRTGGIAPL